MADGTKTDTAEELTGGSEPLSTETVGETPERPEATGEETEPISGTGDTDGVDEPKEDAVERTEPSAEGKED